MISVSLQEYAPLPNRVSTDRQLELCHWEWMELPTTSEIEIAPDEFDVRWKPAIVPGTAAAAAELNGDDIYRESYDFDANDHYFRCKFSVPDSSTDFHSLRFDGLATFADVWLDDVHILTSKSMFQGHHLLLENLGSGEHRLLIRFSALETLLAERRTRPRWKTKLVRKQNLSAVGKSL